MEPFTRDLNVICGHYGTGKTNLCLNLALDCAKNGKKVTLIDIDVANVYFRSADYAKMLSGNGIKVLGPVFADSNVDIPALHAGISSAIEEDEFVIIDVGGDDVGATTLGRYSKDIVRRGYDMFCVINRYRSLTTSPEDAVNILHEIENASHLKVTGLINNSHLKNLTTPETILDSIQFAETTSEIAGIPLLMTTAPRRISHLLNNKIKVHPIDVYVGAPWENGEVENAKGDR